MPRTAMRRPVMMSGELTARIMFGGRSSSMSSQIVAWVRDALFAKKLKPGDFLGTGKDLAARFAASRIVARDALRTLDAPGIVEIRMGTGGGAPPQCHRDAQTRRAHPGHSYQAHRSDRAARCRRGTRADGRPRQDDPRPARCRARTT